MCGVIQPKGPLFPLTFARTKSRVSGLLCRAPARPWACFEQLKPLLDQNLAGHLAQRRARHVLVARETVEIDPGQDIAESIVREAEEQVVGAVHLALDVETDVRQRLAWNRKDLGVAQVYEIDPYLDGVILVVWVAKRRVH